MKNIILKIIIIILLVAIALFLHLYFYIGFVLIVRPPFQETEELTLLAMKNFCLIECLKNLIYSLLGSIFLWFLLKYFFKNKTVVFLLILIFLVISNFGSIKGSYEYFYGLQSEFKYFF